MIKGLAYHVFSVPVQAGEITGVADDGQRIHVRTWDGGTVELALSRDMSPRAGHYVVEYPTGHIEILSPEAFALKAFAGNTQVGADTRTSVSAPTEVHHK